MSFFLVLSEIKWGPGKQGRMIVAVGEPQIVWDYCQMGIVQVSSFSFHVYIISWIFIKLQCLEYCSMLNLVVFQICPNLAASLSTSLLKSTVCTIHISSHLSPELFSSIFLLSHQNLDTEPLSFISNISLFLWIFSKNENSISTSQFWNVHTCIFLPIRW